MHHIQEEEEEEEEKEEEEEEEVSLYKMYIVQDVHNSLGLAPTVLRNYYAETCKTSPAINGNVVN